MKKLFLALALSASAHAEPTIAVSQIIEHPALNNAYVGMQEVVKEAGLAVKWIHENAQGNTAVAQQIAEKFVGLNPNIVVGIGTPSAQALQNVVNGQIPLVFSAITDPVEAKLVSAWDKTEQNITGISDSVPVDKNIELMTTLIPNLKTIGTIYNSGEANSVASIKALQKALGDKIQLQEATATKTSEVLDATYSLLGKVDALFIVQDNTVISAIESVLQASAEQNIPVFVSNADAVEQGALGSVSFNYHEVGRSTGQQLVEILKGKAVKEIPVGTPVNLDVYLNIETAKRLKIELPEALLSRAKTYPQK